MTLTDAITRLNYILRGTDDDAPTSGTDEYTYWLDTLNRKKNELYYDTTNTWRTAYSVESLGSVSASAAPTYDLPTNFLSPASNPYIITADSNRVDQVLSTPQAQNPNIRTFYIAGQNPQVLYCTTEIYTIAYTLSLHDALPILSIMGFSCLYLLLIVINSLDDTIIDIKINGYLFFTKLCSIDIELILDSVYIFFISPICNSYLVIYTLLPVLASVS